MELFVIVVDSNPIEGAKTAQKLTEKGHKVAYFNDPLEAYQKLGKVPVDVILTHAKEKAFIKRIQGDFPLVIIDANEALLRQSSLREEGVCCLDAIDFDNRIDRALSVSFERFQIDCRITRDFQVA